MNTEDLYRVLRAGDVQAQSIFDTIADPMLVLDQGLRIESASRSFFETFKVSRAETIGQRIYDLGAGQWDIPGLRLLLGEIIPKSTAIVNYEIEADFPALGRRTMLLTARTLFHPYDASTSLLLIIVDATDRFRRDTAKDVLFGELQHRFRNLLSVVQAMARHTTTKGRSAEQYRDDFLGRFRALVETQELAFGEQNETGLASLVEAVLAPYATDAEAVMIERGSAVELAPRALQSLGLVLHELATNAAKYGALSVSSGKVRISWRTEEANTKLRLKWVESGGPPVAEPTATGFGTHLIQFTAAHSLRGQVRQDYASDGLRVEILIPLGKALAGN